MSRSFAAAIAAASLLLLAAGLSSCTTTDHLVALAPPDLPVPISASAYYADAAGKTVPPEGYAIIDHFAFEKTFKGPINKPGYTSVLDIAPDILPLVRDKKADAVVNLAILPKSYDDGNSTAISMLKIIGPAWIGIGVAIGIAALSDDTTGKAVGGMPYIFDAMGAGALGAALIMQSTGRTTFVVGFEGDLAKKK
jgi:hypothetical protein